MYAEPSEEPTVDATRKMRIAMSRALKLAATIRTRTSPVKAINMSGERGAGDSTVPGDWRCWALDIETLTRRLSQRYLGNGKRNKYFVHPKAHMVVTSVEIQGKRFRDVATELEISRAKVGEIMDQSAWAFGIAALVCGKKLDPYEEN